MVDSDFREPTECQRCGALLPDDEGICPTCGHVYGRETAFQLPQVTREQIEAAKNRARRGAAKPGDVQVTGEREERKTQPAPAPVTIEPPPRDVSSQQAVQQRAKPPSRDKTERIDPAMLQEGGEQGLNVVLVFGVLVGAMIVGIVMGVLILK